MVDYDALLKVGRDLLIAIGEDPDRDGLQDTPKRFAKWWTEFMDYDAGSIDTSFAIKSNSLVAVSNITVWSLCEHHLLPFKSKISIAYIPSGKILGLSKFARIAHKAAHKPQVQERLVNEIADQITEITRSSNVAVIADGEHLCMTMRGIRTPATMHTSELRGAFRKESTRNELWHILSR